MMAEIVDLCNKKGASVPPERALDLDGFMKKRFPSPCDD
jgi:hypothetical protein